MADQVGLKEKRDNRDLNEYPEDLKEDYLFLSGWIKELSQKYREKILIKVIDVQSFQGVYKSIRYGVHRYPSFIVDKKKKYTGKDKNELDALLQQYLEIH
ncbi:MAG: hypothetical protein OEW45_08600 [Deltaproteobacteria bacterium]|jgi:hypothetical protein|nr:hypothetical protein [Deltaproteobacteria bacterium]